MVSDSRVLASGIVGRIEGYVELILERREADTKSEYEDRDDQLDRLFSRIAYDLIDLIDARIAESKKGGK